MQGWGPGSDEPRTKTFWAVIRMTLGVAQMAGALTSFYLLARTGVTDVTLGAVVATCLLTTTSVLLFGRRRG